MVGGDSSEFYLLHRAVCFKKANQAIEMALKEKPKVSLKSSCIYCESTRHQVAECGDFQRNYLRLQPQESVHQPLLPRSPTHPHSDQMDEDKPEEERFDGYDRPGGAQSGNTEGAGGANIAGGHDPRDPVLLHLIVMDLMPYPLI